MGTVSSSVTRSSSCNTEQIFHANVALPENAPFFWPPQRDGGWYGRPPPAHCPLGDWEGRGLVRSLLSLAGSW